MKNFSPILFIIVSLFIISKIVNYYGLSENLSSSWPKPHNISNLKAFSRPIVDSSCGSAFWGNIAEEDYYTYIKTYFPKAVPYSSLLDEQKKICYFRLIGTPEKDWIDLCLNCTQSKMDNSKNCYAYMRNSPYSISYHLFMYEDGMMFAFQYYKDNNR